MAVIPFEPLPVRQRLAFGCMWMIAFVPDKATVYLSLGVMPFVVEALPASWRPNIEWRASRSSPAW